MAYCDPRVWPRKDAGTYRDYVSRLGEICTRLSVSGRLEVVLFATTQSDMRTVRDVYDDVERRTNGEGHGVSVASTATIDDLFKTMSGLDFVVASRLHGVLLSHIAARPVVALAYDRKVDRHMESMDQVEYLLPIDDFTVDACLELVRRLQMEGDAVRSLLRSRVREHARQVRADVERAVSLLAEGQVPA